jgi:hypothetical protein
MTENVEELIKKANIIYNNKKTELEPLHNGKYVAIEVDSEETFIGDTRDEAVLNAKNRFPEKIFFVKRIGGIDKVASHYSSYYSNLDYARNF